MTLPALAFTVFYFTTHAYLLYKQDRFVLLVLVLFSFMQKTVQLDEHFKVPVLPCGTGNLLSIMSLSAPFPHSVNPSWVLHLTLTPHPPLPPALPLPPGAPAALKGALSLLDSVPLRRPSPDPPHILPQSTIEHMETAFAPGLGPSSLICSRLYYFTFNSLNECLYKTDSARPLVYAFWKHHFITTM